MSRSVHQDQVIIGRDGATGPSPISGAGAAPSCGGVSGHSMPIRSGEVDSVGLLHSVDWLQGSAPMCNFAEVRRGLTSWFGEPEDFDWGRYRYSRSCRFECGAALYWSEGERPEFCISLPGQACATFSPGQMRELLLWLHQRAFRASRVDVALDDTRSEFFDLDVIDAACKRRELVRFVKWHRRTDNCRGRVSGDEIEIGARGGDGVSVKFYNKGLESDGRIPGVRMESRFSGKMAALLQHCLASSSSLDQFSRCLLQSAVGALEFRELSRCSSDRHRRNRPLCSWWQRVVDVVGRSRLVVHRAKSNLDRAAGWIKKQVSGTIGLIHREIERAGYDAWAVLRDWLEPEISAAMFKRPAATLDVHGLIGLRGDVGTT